MSSQLSRRRFLQRTGELAGAAALLEFASCSSRTTTQEPSTDNNIKEPPKEDSRLKQKRDIEVLEDFLKTRPVKLERARSSLYEIQIFKKYPMELRKDSKPGEALEEWELENLGYLQSYKGFGEIKSGKRLEDIKEGRRWEVVTDKGKHTLFLGNDGQARVFLNKNWEMRIHLGSEEKDDTVSLVIKHHSTHANAVHIGRGFFLTSGHIIDDEKELDDLSLLNQSERASYNPNRYKFKIVADSPEDEITLIEATPADEKQASRLRTGPSIHLSATDAQPGELVSSLDQLTGGSKTRDKTIDLRGSDFYNPGQQVDLGSIRFHARPNVLETQGKVIPYDADAINREHPPHTMNRYGTRNPEIYSLATLLRYDGESGEVIHRVTPNGYELAGIFNGWFGRKEWIETPDHPLGYEKCQHITAEYTKTGRIRELIQKHIETLRKPTE